MTTLEILIAARALIQSDGFYHPGIGGCGISAVHRAVSIAEGFTQDHPDRKKAVSQLHSACIRLFDKPIPIVSDRMGLDAIILAFDVAIGDYPEHAIKEPAYVPRDIDQLIGP